MFSDDPDFQAVARNWAEEEVQHGQALGRWAHMADPSFDFARTFKVMGRDDEEIVDRILSGSSLSEFD